MERIIKNKWKIIMITFCFCISFIVLCLTSNNSFLYPLNEWTDVNAFFTVGKSMMNGIAPYVGLFEQKGLLLYFIYGIAYLISNTTFIGVFLLEVFAWTATLYYTYKCINLFLNKKWAFIIVPLFITLICTSGSFVYGGSVEEFCLPLFMITLFFFLDFFKHNEITYKRLGISGLCAGCILISKYTLLGFWFAFMACIFFSLIKKKEYKKSVISCLAFLVGMTIPFMIAIIYMAINGGVREFFNVYFFINMTAYGDVETGIIERLFGILNKVIRGSYIAGILQMFLILLMPIFLIKMRLNRTGKLSIVILYGFTILGIYWGLVSFGYYFIPIEIFMIISLISIATVIDKFLKLDKSKGIILSGISAIVTIIASYYSTAYKDCRFMKKEELFQNKFAEIINQEENPTLVNMGGLDCGVYTVSDIVPTTYFFMKQNISYDKYPDNIDGLKEYIKEKVTMFIVYYTTMNIEELKEEEPELFDNYDLITYEIQTTKPGNNTGYLFKRKD